MKNIRLLYIVFTLLYSLRILFLDADLWEFNQAGVQPLDEVYYNEIGILISQKGWGCLFSGELNEISLAGSKLFLIPNLISAISFNIFGMNFFGLRIGYIMIGLISGILLINITLRIIGKNWTILLIAAFYLLDFNLLLLSRSATNVLPCMLSLLLFLLILISNISICAKNFFVGFLPVFYLFAIYANMPFLIIFSFVYVLFEIIVKKTNIKEVLPFYLIGFLLALVTCEILDYSIFHHHVFDVFGDTLSAQSGKIETSVIGFLVNLRFFFISNMFKYNPLLLFEFFAILPIAINKIIKNGDRTAFIILLIISLHYAQTIFLNNATLQKSTISYPLVVLIIVYCIKDQLYYTNKSMLYRCYIISMAIISYLLFIYSNEMFPAFNANIRKTLYSIMCFSLLFMNIKSNEYLKFSLASFTILICFIFLDYYYVFSNRTYYDLAMMKSINTYSEKKNIISTKGVCLYNNTESLLDAYDIYKGRGYDKESVITEVQKLLNYYGDIYFFCYSSDELKKQSYVMSEMNKRNKKIVEETRFVRKYKIQGKDANLSLYHIYNN